MLSRNHRTAINNVARPVSLVFRMWKQWAERKTLKKKYKEKLGTLHEQIAGTMEETKLKGSDHAALNAQLEKVVSTLTKVEGSKETTRQRDIFSSEFLELLFE